MNCDPLPRTGPDDLVLLSIIALACVVVGAVLVGLARRRRGAPVTLATAVLAGVALLLGPGAAAPAEAVDCSLTVTQTSTMAGLAPGIAPVPITGRVVNNGPDSTYIDVVTVEITSVTSAQGTPAAGCDASDYLLLEATMAVGKTLRPDGGAAPFSGASIGFANKAINQDACQHATIHLRYTANPASRQ